VRKQADPIGKELGRDLTATPHHFLSGYRESECFLVKLDREPVAHTDHVVMVFAAILHAVLSEYFRVDLVPPRLGIGEHAVEIEDYSR
jgi:hypothetical protein